jgi:hypothetical protein
MSRDFKGSVFIELESTEEMERVKGLAIEFEGAPLRMMPKKEYLKMKLDARKSRPNAQKVRRPALEACVRRGVVELRVSRAGHGKQANCRMVGVGVCSRHWLSLLTRDSLQAAY